LVVKPQVKRPFEMMEDDVKIDHGEILGFSWLRLGSNSGLSWTWIILTYSLTHSMVRDIIWKADSHLSCQKISCFLYGTRRFITVFTKARHWTLSRTSRVQFAPSTPISLRSSLMLSSHLRIGNTNIKFHRSMECRSQWPRDV
jgi:hypothetical protein